MKVRITRPGGYTDRYGVEHPHGSDADLPDAIAAKLVAHGIAETPPEPPKTKARAEVVETAAVAPPENTAKRTKAPYRKKA